ncbi:peptidoglycan-binding protein [Streptomyces sp. NPDC052101]|uniref:peptidoglycan-binding protein n=1 Tax=Streptomyces sp. NPDC052101 TaxID=3155763 RepID=UPI0034300651
MTTPVFEEIDPASDCDCPGCVRGRRAGPRPSSGRPAGHPAAACSVVAVAAASAVLGAVTPAAALTLGRPAEERPHVPGDGDTETPQGPMAPLHGPGGRPARGTAAIPAATRAQIINRAKTWVAARVPYTMNRFWSDGYRQDCSGYVSMAWGLPGNEWTGSLYRYAVKITKDQLQPGDILLYHNRANPQRGSHVVIFGGWTDYTHKAYTVYEQTPPHTRRKTAPYPYWSHADKYIPYRYKGVTSDSGGGAHQAQSKPKVAYPGAVYFGPGASNDYVTLLGQMLVARGGRSYYPEGPGPVWGDADRRATLAFQLAQGWSGSEADGLPGPDTWDLLATGKGKDIAPGAAGEDLPRAHGVPGYPGRDHFRPGAQNEYVTRLRRQLVKKGFGRFYAGTYGARWGDADRRAVAAFQRAQGWRGGTADGYPGPETWRRLFADAGGVTGH